jgi:hypothetical protein
LLPRSKRVLENLIIISKTTRLATWDQDEGQKLNQNPQGPPIIFPGGFQVKLIASRQQQLSQQGQRGQDYETRNRGQKKL